MAVLKKAPCYDADPFSVIMRNSIITYQCEMLLVAVWV